MNQRTFTTKEAAIEAGYVFLPAKTIEYVTDNQGRVTGKIQRVDVSGGNSFGYDFQIGAYRQTDDGWQHVANFGDTVDLYVTEAVNKGGRRGAVYTNAIRRIDYDAAIEAARAAI